jgi:hypothetical protein
MLRLTEGERRVLIEGAVAAEMPIPEFIRTLVRKATGTLPGERPLAAGQLATVQPEPSR